MKKAFIIPILLFTALCCLQIGCKKEQEPPTPVASYSNLSFGAKVNGRAFVANQSYLNSCGISENPIHTFYTGAQGKQWYIVHALASGEEIYIALEMPVQKGWHQLIGFPTIKTGLPDHYAYYRRVENGINQKYETTDNPGGTIDVLEFDPDKNGRRSLAFEFIAKKSGSTETVTITKGMFKNFR